MDFIESQRASMILNDGQWILLDVNFLIFYPERRRGQGIVKIAAIKKQFDKSSSFCSFVKMKTIRTIAQELV